MSEPKFAFEKILGVSPIILEDPHNLAKMIERLLFVIKETNQLHSVSCPFFRLDFRQYYQKDGILPIGSLVLDLKFGSKEELEEGRNHE